MHKDSTDPDRKNLYLLSTGDSITSLAPFTSPLEEYRAAFIEREHPFLNYYTFEKGGIRKQSLSRGEFWDLAQSAASCLSQLGIGKGDRVIHCFSANSLHDLALRLAAVLVGSVPVTINWQADDNERICYKANVTGAKLLVYDHGFNKRVAEFRPELPGVSFFPTIQIEHFEPTSGWSSPTLDYEDERIIVFTSGTTARPKGVSLPHRSYLANRLTFENWLGMSEDTDLDLLLVNPLHHANSTALSDWGMRRPRAIIHLVERYSTQYWKILAEAAEGKRGILFAALVSRHIDFLESLVSTSRLPVAEDRLKEALAQTEIMIGSAPVGPKTVKHVLNFSGHLPRVRFGSTETCLEVVATPMALAPEALLESFEAGWSHRHRGEAITGYYIGREHYPFTRIKVVKSIDPEAEDYMRQCETGEPGYLITQGANTMNGYVGDAEATESVLREGWYVGLKDIAFTLRNKSDGEPDYYWMSRDSELLIRGGVNYAYDQVAAELNGFLAATFQMTAGEFQLAVVGLRLESEHEDSCCVTIELDKEAGHHEAELKADFLEKARQAVSKGSRPDYLRFAPIPRNFKGAILYPRLKQEFLKSVKQDAVFHRR
ncbi:MAG: class I adenylate-forming enzyme family protein [Dehalococcoidales bacterium]|nr:class I adenylate-forming enzyme family protein [Dehalococcoidales bacterium]